MKKISDSILYTEADHTTDRPMLAAVLGTEKVFMVDAGASRKHALEFLEALRLKMGRSPDYVVLTHWHWDHSFGLTALRETGATAIAHHLCAGKLGVLLYIPREKCLFLGDMMAHDLYADPPRYRWERVKKLFHTIDGIPALHYVESHGEPADREQFYRENGILRTIARLAAEGLSREMIESRLADASGDVLDLFMLLA